MAQFKTNDETLTQEKIDELSTITKKDVDNAINRAEPELKEFLNAEIYKSINKNYTLGK